MGAPIVDVVRPRLPIRSFISIQALCPDVEGAAHAVLLGLPCLAASVSRVDTEAATRNVAAPHDPTRPVLAVELRVVAKWTPVVTVLAV